MGLLQEWYLHETKNSEDETLHRSQKEEYLFYRAVSSGDLDTVRKNCEMKKFTDLEGVGTLSRNPVTNLKYHFVITTAFITRFCMEAGMETEQAYRLSDFYILKLDNLNTVSSISELHDRMVLDFTFKMHMLQKSTTTSKPVAMVIEYIYAHIKERITVEDLAQYVELSASYLSRLFKEETGISISDYIREKKVERAQNLLKFSDYSPVDIANYLSFSSQSHFIQIFKKYVGMTPKKYRDLNYSPDWSETEKKPDTDKA